MYTGITGTGVPTFMGSPLYHDTGTSVISICVLPDLCPTGVTADTYQYGLASPRTQFSIE